LVVVLWVVKKMNSAINNHPKRRVVKHEHAQKGRGRAQANGSTDLSRDGGVAMSVSPTSPNVDRALPAATAASARTERAAA